MLVRKLLKDYFTAKGIDAKLYTMSDADDALAGIDIIVEIDDTVFGIDVNLTFLIYPITLKLVQAWCPKKRIAMWWNSWDEILIYFSDMNIKSKKYLKIFWVGIIEIINSQKNHIWNEFNWQLIP